MRRTSNVQIGLVILSAAVIVLASSWAIGSPASAAEVGESHSPVRPGVGGAGVRE